MPGITSGGLSSNWKKLQEKLQADKKPEDSTKSNGTKRKRSTVEKEKEKQARPTPTARNVKQKLSGSSTGTQRNKRRDTMGSYISTPTSSHSQTSSKPLSSLTTDHDIPAADLTAAYGSTSASSHPPRKTNPTSSPPEDLTNTGLHPTHRAGKYLSLDCEMVGTGPPPHADDLLARVSLVNFHGEQIYDSFVLPPSGSRDEVRDYRSHVSGVTPWHLRPGYARPFSEAQSAVRDLLRDRILVGHALKKDLLVLGLGHPRRDVRDTSRYAKFRVESRGKPPALRNLARSELGLVIQEGQHSSVEDARATMALFRKEKEGFEVENGWFFGTWWGGGPVGKGKGRREESEEVEGGGSAGGEDEDDDDLDEEDIDEEDLDLLEGEEDEFAQMKEESGAARKKTGGPDKKKRKKKKSRTKRK